MNEGRDRLHRRDRARDDETADVAGPVDPNDAAVRARRQAVEGEREKTGGTPGLGEENAERERRRRSEGIDPGAG
jgi:hypothetical protein